MATWILLKLLNGFVKRNTWISLICYIYGFIYLYPCIYPPSTNGRSSCLLVDTRMACFCNPLSCKNFISVLKPVSTFASWLLLVSLTTILMREEQSCQNPRSINVKIKMAQSTQLYIYIFTYGFFCYFLALCQTKPSWSLTNISKLVEASGLNKRFWISQSIQCLGSNVPLAMFSSVSGPGSVLNTMSQHCNGRLPANKRSKINWSDNAVSLTLSHSFL